MKVKLSTEDLRASILDHEKAIIRNNRANYALREDIYRAEDELAKRDIFHRSTIARYV